jgi:hypothetical protein
MSSLSMATAVCARSSAGATASTPAIAATLKYSLFLHLIRALLVLLIGGIVRGRFARGPRLRVGRDCAWVDAAPQQCLRLKWRRPAGTPLCRRRPAPSSFCALA